MSTSLRRRDDKPRVSQAHTKAPRSRGYAAIAIPLLLVGLLCPAALATTNTATDDVGYRATGIILIAVALLAIGWVVKETMAENGARPIAAMPRKQSAYRRGFAAVSSEPAPVGLVVALRHKFGREAPVSFVATDVANDIGQVQQRLVARVEALWGRHAS